MKLILRNNLGSKHSLVMTSLCNIKKEKFYEKKEKENCGLDTCSRQSSQLLKKAIEKNIAGNDNFFVECRFRQYFFHQNC